MVIIEAKEKRFFEAAGCNYRTFLLGLSNNQKNQIKSREK